MTCSLDRLSPDQKIELRDVLISQRTSEIPNPVLPAFDDFDGDGTPDFFGLNDSDELVVISGATLEDSLYESTGDDQ